MRSRTDRFGSQVTSALIDGKDTPDFTFTLADDLDKERLRARDMLFSGQADQAIEAAEAAVAHLDQVYAAAMAYLDTSTPMPSAWSTTGCSPHWTSVRCLSRTICSTRTWSWLTC